MEGLFENSMKLFPLLSRFRKQCLAIADVETRVGIALQTVDDGAILRRRRDQVDTAPAQSIDRERIDVLRINAALAKCFDKSDAIVVSIIADQIEVRSNQAAKVFAKRNVYRRHVVQRPDAHV